MGTIVIEEYTTAGGPGAVNGAPVVNLSTLLKTTVDSTTSTSAENVTLNQDTRFISVHAAEDHRVSVLNSDATDQYCLVAADGLRDFAVNKNNRTLYYRADA